MEQVELDEVHVLELRREKCRRSRNSTSPVRRSASSLPGTKAVSDRQDAADAAGRGSLPDEVGISLDMSHVNSFVSVTSDERCPSPIASECVGSLDDSFERGFSQRSSSLDSTSSKVGQFRGCGRSAFGVGLCEHEPCHLLLYKLMSNIILASKVLLIELESRL